MASKARFGRLPRAAPSLTSTIVALAQQYQNQRDSNITSAWTKGGDFEGKAVTDKAFIDHWKQRMSGISADDPMHDYYANLISNYDFQIAESKIGQRYAEKSVNEGQMANFYRTWAAKLPVDSEAYRNLMTKAAQFRAAASARARGGRATAANSAYVNAQNSTYSTTEQPFRTMTDLMAQYAVANNILDPKDLKDKDGGWSKLINADGEQDPSNLAHLFSMLEADPRSRAYITDVIRKNGNPGFSGTFNAATIADMTNTARNGANISANRAQANGHKGDANSARTRAGDISEAGAIFRVTMGATPGHSFIEENDAARAQMDGVLDPNSGASPMERKAAIATYQDWLNGTGMKLATRGLPPGALQPGSANFDPFATGIVARLNGTVDALNGRPTGKTLKDDPLALSTKESGPSSDAAQLGVMTSGLLGGLDSVAAGRSITVRTDGKGTPDPNGNVWEIVDRNSPKVVNNPNLVPVPGIAYTTHDVKNGYPLGGDAGEIRYESSMDVKVALYGVRDPATGRGGLPIPAAPGSDTTVGKVVTIRGPDGTLHKQYGIYVGGQIKWTPNDPFVNDPTEKVDVVNGVEVHSFLAAPGQDPQHPTGLPGAAVKAAKGGPPIMPPIFDPQNYVAKGSLVTNPAPGGKQTAWDSVWGSFINSSTPVQNWAIGMGDQANLNAERAYWTDPNNWTAAMKAQQAQGVDPTTIVEQQSQNLIKQIDYNRINGVTPEQQAATRTQNAAQAAGLTPSQYSKQQSAASSIAARSDLITQLQTWNAAQPTDSDLVAASRTPGTTVGRISGTTLPAGWTVGDLLNQPGMTLQQAQDLVAQITGGQRGAFMPGTTTTRAVRPTPFQTGAAAPPGVAVTTPYDNPFMPKAGELGASATSDPSSIAGRAGWGTPTPQPFATTPTPATPGRIAKDDVFNPTVMAPKPGPNPAAMQSMSKDDVYTPPASRVSVPRSQMTKFDKGT